jgi:hypothetical protein
LGVEGPQWAGLGTFLPFTSAVSNGRFCHKADIRGLSQPALINDHIDHCLVCAEKGEGPQHAIDQFRAISKYW